MKDWHSCSRIREKLIINFHFPMSSHRKRGSATFFSPLASSCWNNCVKQTNLFSFYTFQNSEVATVFYAVRVLHFSFFNIYLNVILSSTRVLPRFVVPSCLPTKMCIPHQNKQDFQIQENRTFCDKLIFYLEVLGLNRGRKHYLDFVIVQF